MSFYSIATREEDEMFSSFVNAVVMSPIHAACVLSVMGDRGGDIGGN